MITVILLRSFNCYFTLGMCHLSNLLLECPRLQDWALRDEFAGVDVAGLDFDRKDRLCLLEVE